MIEMHRETIRTGIRVFESEVFVFAATFTFSNAGALKLILAQSHICVMDDSRPVD